MEYPIILVQEIVLIFLVLKYMGFLGTNSFACFGLYIAITGAFLCGVLPKTIIAVLAVSIIMQSIHLSMCLLNSVLSIFHDY